MIDLTVTLRVDEVIAKLPWSVVLCFLLLCLVCCCLFCFVFVFGGMQLWSEDS